MPTINDTQFNQLKTVTDGMAPVMDKMEGGDTNLTSADMTKIRQSYDAWRTTLDSAA